ncbi:MAG: cellulase family glycosylhydrolase [Bacteroidota bacterium]
MLSLNSLAKKPGLILFAALLLAANIVSAQGFLRRQGTRIVNDNGPVLLRGTNLGSWMVPEGYIIAGVAPARNIDTPRGIFKGIQDVTGSEQTAWDLKNEQRLTWITRADIQHMRTLGFNHVRVPFHYADFYDTTSNRLKNDGFRWLDSVVNWCRESNMYVIPDLHCAPGSQNEGPHADHNQPVNLFWYVNNNQKIAASVWKSIARRYANETVIGGYDLLNEPQIYGADTIKVINFYKQCRDSIRLVDRNHMLIAEANNWAYSINNIVDNTTPTKRFDDNMCLSVHAYWTVIPNTNIPDLTNRSIQMDVPVWLGEFGENSNTWIATEIKDFEARGWGWCIWTYKKVNTIGGIVNIPITPGYQAIINYWAGTGPKPSPTVATQSLHEFYQGLVWRPTLDFRKDYIDALTRPDFLTRAVPFKDLHIPGLISLCDFNMGSGNGVGCKSSSYWNQSSNQSNLHNQGNWYRNDAIDIQLPTGASIPNIGWTEDNEWMDYTLTVDNANDSYGVKMSAASAGAGGRIRLELDGNVILPAFTFGGTGSWTTFNDFNLGNVSIPDGVHTLRFYIEKAGFNVRSLQFTSVNGTGPVLSPHTALKLSPNPAGNMLHIESSAALVSIYDAQGRMVAQTAGSSLLKELNISSLLPGVYAVRSGSQTARFVKE